MKKGSLPTGSARVAALLTGLAVVGSAPVAAQTKLAFHAGPSIASISADDLGDASSRVGLNVGAAITLGLSGNVGLQLGAGYVQKGATFSEDDVDVTFAVDYFEVPVLLRFGVPTTGSISPHFLIGPALSFEASCEAQGSDGGLSASVDCSEAEVDTEAFDIGAMAGAGLSIGTSGPVSITLDVLYNHSLKAFASGDPDEEAKHRAWSILAGVELGIG